MNCKFFTCLLLLIFSTICSAEKILIVKFKDIQAVNEVVKGFQDTINNNKTKVITLETDTETLFNELESFKPDLILAIGSAALEVVSKIKDIPIVFTTVLVPQKFVAENQNICGVSASIPISDKIKILTQIKPSVRNAGVIYSNPNLTETLKKESSDLRYFGFELKPRKVSTSKDFFSTIENLKDSVDAFVMVPDNTGKDEFFNHTVLVCLRRQIPFVGLSEPQVEKNALFSLSVDHYENGLQASLIAEKLLSKKFLPFQIGIENPLKNHLTINLKTAKQINVKIPDNILALAKKIYE
ncbi:hypothetical protein IT568_09070 [bacterium]|nr:hypothetical protein [bacterium]